MHEVCTSIGRFYFDLSIRYSDMEKESTTEIRLVEETKGGVLPLRGGTEREEG
jgi:hypothetical protein